MEQIAKIQEQIENKPWKTAIAVFKNGKSYFENSLAKFLSGMYEKFNKTFLFLFNNCNFSFIKLSHFPSNVK